MKAQRKRVKRAARRKPATRADGEAPNAVVTAVRRLLPEIRRLVREAQRCGVILPTVRHTERKPGRDAEAAERRNQSKSRKQK
jgi:hypothetical protein